MAKVVTQSRSNNEIVGKPGTLWGPIPVPLYGRITVKVVGDILQATTTSGLAQQTLRVRVQNIDNVDIQEAPNYFLLTLGGILSLIGGLNLISALMALSEFYFTAFIVSLVGSAIFLVPGVLIVLYTINNKNRLLTFRTPCAVIPIFLTMETAIYDQFGNNVLLLARQLNSSSTPSVSKKPQPTSPQSTR